MDEQVLKEEYCVLNGWEKKQGYRVDCSSTYLEDCDYVFVEEDDVSKTEYWVDKNGDDENAFDNIDDLLEYIDDNKEDETEMFEAFKAKRLEAKG